MKRACAVAAILCAPALATAQPTVVVGTHNPDIDVPAVQAAVNQGGQVILKGRFSFDAPPMVPLAFQNATGVSKAMVLISKEVAISGVPSDDDEMARIDAGTIPFYVDAPGAHVTIQGLHYVRPTPEAVFVYTVSGLVITFCRIDGVEPRQHVSTGILVASGTLPAPTNPGNPGKLAGPLLITNNDIDMTGGTDADNTLGIVVFSAGLTADNGVDVYISGNRISHVTEPAVDIRRIGGRLHVEGNVVTTGNVVSMVNPGPEVIRVANIGSYVIAHNSVFCEWPDLQAKGITVFSQFADWPMQGAIVADNDVMMSAEPDTVFGDSSAGIDIRGFANANIVTNNRIRGRARAAILIEVFKGGAPDRNELILNRFDGFDASDADIVVGSGVTNTRVVGQGTHDDQGSGTVFVPLPSVRWIR